MLDDDTPMVGDLVARADTLEAGVVAPRASELEAVAGALVVGEMKRKRWCAGTEQAGATTGARRRRSPVGGVQPRVGGD